MFTEKHSISKQDANLARAGAFDDLNKIKAIKGRMTWYSVALFALGLVMVYPMHILIFGGVGFMEKLGYISWYATGLIDALTSGSQANLAAWFRATIGWYASAAAAGIMTPEDPASISVVRLGIVAFVNFTPAIIPVSLVPVLTKGLSSTPNIYGDTRWADERDIESMSKRDLVGFDGRLFPVGKMKNKMIRMKETLSVLLLAPPGTGKTVAFIVPSAVSMDNSCQLLNDQKPELFFMTSGHRSTLGPVFQLMWSAQDMPKGGWITEEQAQLMSPDLIEHGPDGEPILDPGGAMKIKPVFYPSWNPIGPASIPSPGPKRDLYIERLVSVLCPDPQGGGDKFWTSRARAALIGLIHYLVAKSEFGQDPDYPDVDENGLPAYWHGKEPCFPMLVDWFAEAQNTAEDSSGGAGGGQDQDPMRNVFKNAIADAKKLEAAYITRHGTPIMNRAIIELTGLMNQPDKTRGSILTTLDEALGPFKNEAVRQRTSSSSFSFNELRGVPIPEAKSREKAKQKEMKSKGQDYQPRYKRDEFKPITIYISVNAEDAKAFATITGIFVDSANAYLVANGPNAIDDRGNQLGPNDFFFLLDEAPTLPKLDTVVNGPAVGRSKRVSYAIVGQDFAQIETRYSKAEVETMKSTTAIKVILSQNNETAAKAVSAMAGSMTFKKANYQTKPLSEDPVTKFLNLKKEVINTENWEKREFIDSSFVMSMPVGRHIVLVQNFMNRPILADTPRYFEDPELGTRVFNLRTGKGPRPALPMPQTLMAASANDAKTAAEARIADISARAALQSHDAMLIVTPDNISILTRDLATQAVAIPPGSEFAIAKVTLKPDEEYFELPADVEITVTSNPTEIADLLANNRVIVFDAADLERVQSVISSAGRPRLHKDVITPVREKMLEIEEEKEGDFFTIGYYGTARTDRPRDPKLITPKLAMNWLCEIVTVLHGCKFEMKRISVEG